MQRALNLIQMLRLAIIERSARRLPRFPLGSIANDGAIILTLFARGSDCLRMTASAASARGTCRQSDKRSFSGQVRERARIRAKT